MKKIININLILFFLAISCAPPAAESEKPTATLFPERAKDMVIYEVNVRQYTPEGTLSAFAKHLPRLEKMGVDILWMMPIQPIGERNRKGSLGSYYSIKDYISINPEFGTLEDFKKLVEEAHQRGMFVILDWVANHTAWDHVWMREREGYYTKDSLGNVIAPVADWSDVADLNYENKEMQDEMIESMRYWVKEADIDGFRCDVAGFVPNEFWNRTKDSLDVDKDLFMLAEWDEPALHSAFHMTYGWGFHHQMNAIAKGEKNVDSLKTFVKADLERYGKKAFRMNFTTNHDENSWNGTVFERFGEGHKAYAVLTFTLQGMPLIYGGQEAGLDKRLAFFEKDTIDWGEVALADFYTKLVDLKKENAALHNGEYGGIPAFIATENENVIAYRRTKDNNEVCVVINLSGEPQQVAFEGSFEFQDYFTGKQVDSKQTAIKPFDYWVGTKTIQP